MTQAKSGDTVQVHYKGSLENGQVFDSSENREPLEFTIGKGQLIPGFEDGVVGMNAGDSRTLTIEPENGYGPRHPELIGQIERKAVPPDLDIAVGQMLQVSQENGQTQNVVVTELTDTHVTLDANHPLAGQTLIFDITLVAIA